MTDYRRQPFGVLNDASDQAIGTGLLVFPNPLCHRKRDNSVFPVPSSDPCIKTGIVRLNRTRPRKSRHSQILSSIKPAPLDQSGMAVLLEMASTVKMASPIKVIISWSLQTPHPDGSATSNQNRDGYAAFWSHWQATDQTNSTSNAPFRGRYQSLAHAEWLLPTVDSVENGRNTSPTWWFRVMSWSSEMGVFVSFQYATPPLQSSKWFSLTMAVERMNRSLSLRVSNYYSIA